jgi:hypothetical protein
MPKYKIAEVVELLTDLDDYETNWNAWERDFLTSLHDKVDSEDHKECDLSVNQYDKLVEIHKKYIK